MAKRVRFVAQGLQHAQGRIVTVEHDRFAPPGQVDLLVAFGQADYRQGRAVDFDQRVDGGRKLSFAAVHHDQIGQRRFSSSSRPKWRTSTSCIMAKSSL